VIAPYHAGLARAREQAIQGRGRHFRLEELVIGPI
jgi:hypothetical protein